MQMQAVPISWIVSHFAALRSRLTFFFYSAEVSAHTHPRELRRIESHSDARYQGVRGIIGQKFSSSHSTPTTRQSPDWEGRQQGMLRKGLFFLRHRASGEEHPQRPLILPLATPGVTAPVQTTWRCSLRRLGRVVFRDEEQVKIGHRLPSQLEASIRGANTFVAL